MENIDINKAPLRTPLKLSFLVLAVVLIWGLSWPVSKIGLGYITPGWFVSFRLMIGTLTTFLIVVFSGKFILPQWRDLPLILVIGLLQIAVFMLFVNHGLHQVDAGRSAILVYTTPIWVIPMAILFFDEKISLTQWLGFFLGGVGILLLLGPWEMDWYDYQTLWGNFYLLMAAFCWAVSMLCARHMNWSRTPSELMFWQLLVATIPVSLLSLFKEPHAVIDWNPTLIACLLYSGILATSLGYWGVVVISKELPSSRASLSFLGVPVSGFLFSALILDESITVSMVAAIVFILVGLIFVALSKKQL